jgi:hypothetical protein
MVSKAEEFQSGQITLSEYLEFYNSNEMAKNLTEWTMINQTTVEEENTQN